MKAILLVGAPRCGKTQLALQMCENKRSVFYDVRSSSLKSFLEHIDTNVDVMVFDDIPEWQLQYYEALVRGGLFSRRFYSCSDNKLFPGMGDKIS
ncbi:hypothetical protein NXX58_04380 [Phocaeicola vulgatus]|uniref:hypothetical protein n=1 Tax=Phocaeicola vulgatus TaxID=821 RepID=UPI0021657600|nr:hypothetical protein [Phocaeicola vulgatus]MCS2903697.1 hypothetical protein [Phocaeicola vulgatus]